jgi:hypothetical protein
MWPRIARSTVAVAVALGVAACGSGVFDSPTGRTTTDSASTTTRTTGSGGETGGTTGGETTGATATGTRYGWLLPDGPQSPSTREDLVYQHLAKYRSCGAAQAELDDGDGWAGMMTPRNVLLYQAAIDLCLGNEPRARAMYGRIAHHGWNLEFGHTEPVDCPTYQAVRSVLDQRDPGSFTCTKGSPPEWPDRRAKDDPRTDSDEATTTTVTTTSPTRPTGTTTTTRTATTTPS